MFGPSKAAAELEGSKAFAKNLMAKYNIPTAFFKVCEDLETAKAYVKEKARRLLLRRTGLLRAKEW